jgi:hypothetical protein
MDGEQCNDPNEAVHFPCSFTPANEDAIVLRRPTFRVIARSRPDRKNAEGWYNEVHSGRPRLGMLSFRVDEMRKAANKLAKVRKTKP